MGAPLQQVASRGSLIPLLLSALGTVHILTFGLQESELAPLRLAVDTLSSVGKNPVKRAVVVSLPTIESAFVTHTAKAVQGWSHPEYPAIRVAIEVLNATESYLWVGVVAWLLREGRDCLTCRCSDTSVVPDWRTVLTVPSILKLASSASRFTGVRTAWRHSSKRRT